MNPPTTLSPVACEVEASYLGSPSARALSAIVLPHAGRRGRKGECVLENSNEPCVLKITGRSAESKSTIKTGRCPGSDTKATQIIRNTTHSSACDL